MEMEFSDRYAVIVWICRNQLGRRNLTDEQKKFLTGKRYEAEKKQNQWRGNQYVSSDDEESGLGEKRPSQNPERTSAIIAKEIGKGERYVRDAEIYANGVEAADEVAPGIKNEILFGKLKCKDKDVMAIARAAPEQREDLVRKLQFPSARAAPGSPVISSPGEEDEVPDEEPAAPAEDTIEDVMYELNDALESMIFRWNFCFETHDAIYRQKANQKRIRLLAKEGINYLKNIGG